MGKMRCMLIQLWATYMRTRPWQPVDSQLCIWPSHIRQERELCTSLSFTSEISFRELQSELINVLNGGLNSNPLLCLDFKNLQQLGIFASTSPSPTSSFLERMLVHHNLSPNLHSETTTPHRLKYKSPSKERNSSVLLLEIRWMS